MKKSLATTLYLAAFISASAINATPLPNSWSGNVTARFGATLAPDDNGASLGLEPVLRRHLGHALTYLQAWAEIERPLDRFQNFKLPRLALQWRQSFQADSTLPLALLVSLGALQLDRLSTDGWRARFSVAGEVAHELVANLRASLRLGVFKEFTRYAQTTDGTTFPRHGLFERLGLEYRYRRFRAEARLVVEQRQADRWKNDFLTLEQVSYAAFDNFEIGLAHELVTAAVDESAGTYNALRFFNARESRISVFVDWRF